MLKKLICGILLLGLVGCQDTQDTQKMIKDSDVSYSLNMANNENRFYLLSGTIGDKTQVAYLYIFKDLGAKDWQIKIVLQDGMDTFVAPLGNMIREKNGKLIVKGVWKTQQDSPFANNAFSFTLKESPINSIMGFESIFMKKKIINYADNKPSDDATNLQDENMQDGNMQDEIMFKQVSTRVFIPPNQMLSKEIIDKINTQIALSSDLKEAHIKQTQFLQDEFHKAQKDWESNTEIDIKYSVKYIDNYILMLEKYDYRYMGGAHGNAINTFEIYSLQNGDMIASGVESLFDLHKNNNLDTFLGLLNQSLSKKKEYLFEDSLPLKKLPNSFYLTNYGVVFVWNAYEIAPYSSGQIEGFVKFTQLQSLIKQDSPLAYLFKH